jgi:hypothetical protein
MANNLSDATLTESQIEDYEDLTNSASNKYINSNTSPLLTIITESTDNTKSNYRAYITEAIRDSLLSILNVNYSS